MSELGFRDFRVRVRGNDALIQIREEDYERYIYEKDDVEGTIIRYFDGVSLDPAFRK
jgi:PP-loop superfamily ATP-utilizing enzyme